MAQDWGQGGEHGQGWLGIGAKAVNCMGRRARMLGSNSDSASSPIYHWDCGAKTWVARHSGKTKQRCWQGSAHGGNDQEHGLVSVVRRGPVCTQTDQLTWMGFGLDHVGLPGRPWSVRLAWTLGKMGATPGGGYGEDDLCRQVANYHTD
ncbi:hypothetical protein TIFTF001_025791 [Ficus carica]|uniref:Uncharacterized protein n=1 Tax=Ficus carica TaxID=3494 RepID=A0AA88APK8_FICCA|nr:hypothetical protein TIFTF001_025791 [Ficus carica]